MTAHLKDSQVWHVSIQIQFLKFCFLFNSGPGSWNSRDHWSRLLLIGYLSCLRATSVETLKEIKALTPTKDKRQFEVVC